ncbi:MAG: GGDEF domain-containing protein [Psychrobium sp.]|nr:GGDEF domain-containing protein [Psychrobium sp.]
MKTKIKLFRTTILIIALVFPLAWLYLHAELGTSRKTHEIDLLLLEVIQVETQLTEHILKSRSQLSLHYDDIAHSQQHLFLLMRKLHALLAENINISSLELKSVEQQSQSLQLVVERFKTAKAQISQLQRYLKLLAENVRLLIEDDPHHIINQVDLIIIESFSAYVFGDTPTDNKLINKIKKLEKHASLHQKNTQLLINNLVINFTKLISLKQQENTILNKVFKHEMRQKIQYIRQRIIDNQYQMVSHGNMTLRYLIIYASCLVMLILFFIFNRRHIQKKVSIHKERSERDHLTQLYNRRFFLWQLEESINSSTGALLFIDLDGFKEINDQLGHHIGDETLKSVANKLNSLAKSINPSFFSAQAYRLGGDEFVILIDDMDEHDALNSLEKFAANVVSTCCFYLDKPFQQYNLSVSVGVALFPEQGTNVASVLNCADKAMYHSKHNGRNCYTFYSEL